MADTTIAVLGRDDVGVMRQALALFGEAFDEPETYTGHQPGDEPAVNLYTKLGTREDVMHFDIGIP